jgi:hypothetical protein
MKKVIVLITFLIAQNTFAWVTSGQYCCSKDQKTPCSIDLSRLPCADIKLNSDAIKNIQMNNITPTAQPNINSSK